MPTRRFIYSPFGHLWFFCALARFQGCTIQCCLRSVNFRGIRSCRSEALCVSDGCNLSFQCCSSATDQQLVAAGGMWWASGMQQLMFFMMQSQHEAGKHIIGSSAASLFSRYLLSTSARGHMTPQMVKVGKHDRCRAILGAQTFVKQNTYMEK